MTIANCNDRSRSVAAQTRRLRGSVRWCFCSFPVVRFRSLANPLRPSHFELLAAAQTSTMKYLAWVTLIFLARARNDEDARACVRACVRAYSRSSANACTYCSENQEVPLLCTCEMFSTLGVK